MPKTRRSRWVPWFAVTACLLVPSCTNPDDPPPERLPDSRTLAAGLASFGAGVLDFDQLRAVLVATGDRTIFEEYYDTGPETYWALQSVTKSVVSTLIGIAHDEGLIRSLDATLAELLPRYADVMPATVARTTLRQLLTMTAGFPEDLSPASADDWVEQVLTHPDLPPGHRFVYSNAGAHLLAAVLRQATGVPVLRYARSRLFDPLDIDTRPAWQARFDSAVGRYRSSGYEAAGFAWPRDPQGVATGWWGIRLRPRDMVKLGQLYLADGRWHGRQVVSSNWVHEATTQQVGTDGLDGYGYEWWIGTFEGAPVFRAVGYGGELIEVVPDRDLVVVAATELRQDDPTSQGIDTGTLTAVIEAAIVSKFPTG